MRGQCDGDDTEQGRLGQCDADPADDHPGQELAEIRGLGAELGQPPRRAGGEKEAARHGDSAAAESDDEVLDAQ